MTYKVVAYNVASSIAIKNCASALNLKPLFSDSDEVFLEFGQYQFVYVFQYGMLSFFNMNTLEISKVMATLKDYSKGFTNRAIAEDIDVIISKDKTEVRFDAVVLPFFNQEMIRLVMLNASQSVALERYGNISEALLEETNNHTEYLESHGKLNISGQKLKKFIGKVLNLKNKISENLYIFDAPDITWEDEQLNNLNIELKKGFDLKDRYHLIHDRLEIIKENLELFKDIMDHKESSRLEWIIILLILVEVVDMFLLKFI